MLTIFHFLEVAVGLNQSTVLNNFMRSWYFSPPLSHSSNVNAQPSRGDRCLSFGQICHLIPYFMYVNLTAKALTRLYYNRYMYHNLMSRLINVCNLDVNGENPS